MSLGHRQPKGLVPALQGRRLCLEDSSQEVSVAGLILAPILEVLEQRVELVLRVTLQMPGRDDTKCETHAGTI